METIGYWICFIAGIFAGKYILTNDFINKFKEKITGKRHVKERITKTKAKAKAKTTSESLDSEEEEYDICPDCHGEEFVYDTLLDKPVKCPTCKGTGKVQKKQK